MTSRCDFAMEIDDAFTMAGRTIFVGVVRNGPNFIQDCDCELIVDDVAVTRFIVAGEALDLVRAKNSRALVTASPIDPELLGRAKGAKLRGITPRPT
jgi:hypothetical protein